VEEDQDARQHIVTTRYRDGKEKVQILQYLKDVLVCSTLLLTGFNQADIDRQIHNDLVYESISYPDGRVVSTVRRLGTTDRETQISEFPSLEQLLLHLGLEKSIAGQLSQLIGNYIRTKLPVSI